MNEVIHFEIPFEDKERAKKFYMEIFGWKLDDMPEMDYTGVTTTPTDEGGRPTTPGAINGGMFQRNPKLKSPVIAINVESIDEQVKKVEASGGTVVEPKTEIPEMGFYAYIKDPEDNVIGLWENLSE